MAGFVATRPMMIKPEFTVEEADALLALVRDVQHRVALDELKPDVLPIEQAARAAEKLCEAGANHPEGFRPDGRVDFSQSFKFTICDRHQPGEPETLTCTINAETVEGALTALLKQLEELQPEGQEKAREWCEIRDQLVASPEWAKVVTSALAMFTDHLSDVTTFAVVIAEAYTLGWALVPVLENAGGNRFRAEFVERMIQMLFHTLATYVMQLQAEVKRIVDEQAGGEWPGVIGEN